MDAEADRNSEKVQRLERRNRELERELDERTAALRHSLDEVKRLTKQLQRENLYLREQMQTPHQDVIGKSAEFAKVMEQARRVASTDATVLLLGETGTGKEVVAHFIHRLSKRRDKSLVRVNAAALTDTLAASELFGHEKGAFTGADRRKVGRFELARGGTIFLDEIGELSLEVQAKLLRVLQEKELERVGGTETIPVDVRVIAATNRDLHRAIGEGRFREDLYHRLNVVAVRLPPLRKRREDVEPLAEYFIERLSRGVGRTFTGLSARTRRLFAEYEWPGNVRELANILERAVILCDGPELDVEPELLSGHREPETAALSSETESPSAAQDTLEAATRAHIAEALSRTRGKIFGADGAAALLGVKPTTLQAKIKRLGMSRLPEL